jgi:hypothetical protein
MKLMKLTLKIGSAILVFVAVLAVPSYSGLRSGALKIQRVELTGTHPTNTVAFFKDYALVAPYRPSREIEESDVITPEIIEALDNNKLYIINTKSPKDEPVEVSLGECYYPSTVLCDGRNAFVRGTAFKETGEAYEVIACVQLHLEDGKPGAGRAVIVEIPGINEETTVSEAPTDMVLGLDGKYLLFTNGVWVFSYNLDEGYVYKVGIFSAKDYGPGSYILFAGFDEATRTLVVSHNLTEERDGESVKRTVLRFYTLESSGALSSLKIVESSEFPDGAFLPPESTVAISADASGAPAFAYMGLSDGSVNQVDLHREPVGDDLFGSLKQIGLISELAMGTSEAGPRITKLDGSGQRVWVTNPGHVPIGIRRPAFGRPVRAGIRRPAFIRSQESPTLFSGQLNGKRTKLVQTTVLADLFSEETSITSLMIQESTEGILTTHSGRVFSIVFTKGIDDAEVEMLGEIGIVDYSTIEQQKIVALSSAEEQDDGTGQLSFSPGSLVIASRKEGKNSSVALSIAQALSHSSPPLAGVFRTIRRPCNLGR